MELESSTNHRIVGAASTVAPEGQHAEIEQQRFSVITPEEASQLPEAKKFLEVGILDRIKGIFSSKQAEINAAKNLLAKPTYEVSRSVRVIADLNNLIKNLNKDILKNSNSPSMASDTIQECGLDSEEVTEKQLQIPLLDKTNYKSFIKDFENVTLTNKLNEAGLNKTEIRLFQLEVEKTVDQYIGHRDQHGEKIARTLSELLTPAMTELDKSDRALMSMQAMTTDTVFRSVVAKATANIQGHDRVKSHEAGKAFVQENNASRWAHEGQRQFLKEVADEFAAAIEGIDSKDNIGTKVDALFTKIDTRARKIAGVLNLKDHQPVLDRLLNQLNQIEGFEESFKKAQGQLLQVVENKQDLSKVSAPQIALITGQQQEIQNAGKKISGSSLKGEEAIKAAFEATLSPQVRHDLTAAVGQEDQEQNLTLTADDAVQVIGETNQAMKTLLAGNREAVREAQTQAELALSKLNLMNQLVGTAKKDDLVVDLERVNQPITYASDETTPLHVARELTGELLEMIDTLANGKGDHAPSPTQLKAVLEALQSETEEEGTGKMSALEVVLRQKIDLKTIFDQETVTFAGQTFDVKHNGVQLVTFLQHADSTEEAPKGIVALRAQIKAVKEAREAEEAARKAPLIGTRTSELAEEILNAPPESLRELDGERISQNGKEAQPSLARSFFRRISGFLQSIISGAANANPLRLRAQRYDVAKEQQQGVILPQESSLNSDDSDDSLVQEMLTSFNDLNSAPLRETETKSATLNSDDSDDDYFDASEDSDDDDYFDASEGINKF